MKKKNLPIVPFYLFYTLFCILVFAGFGLNSVEAAATKNDQEIQKGMTFFVYYPEKYDEAEVESALKTMSEWNCNWVSFSFAFQQKRYDDPHIYLPYKNSDGLANWHDADTDRKISHFVETAHSNGLKVMFKPHVHPEHSGMRVDGSDPQWSGTISMKTEADWGKWFRNHYDILEYYVKKFDFDSICIASELSGTYGREADWRNLIARLRRVTDIPITCGFNWWVVIHHQKKVLLSLLTALRWQEKILDGLLNKGGYGGVEFDKGLKKQIARDCVAEYPDWTDALDYVGLTFYFPLSDKADPDIKTLKSAWRSYKFKMFRISVDLDFVEAIRDWGKSINKPIVFTEGGWAKWNYATKYPANWYGLGESNNPELQGRCYQAFFDEVFSSGMGAYFWLWNGGAFSPEGEPTESIVKKYYGNSKGH